MGLGNYIVALRNLYIKSAEDGEDIVYHDIDIDITVTRDKLRYGYIKSNNMRCCIGPLSNAFMVWVAEYADLDDKGAMCFLGFKTKADAFKAFLTTFSKSQPVNKLRGLKSYTLPKFKETLGTADTKDTKEET